MASLDFPASPTDGQVFGNWVWSASKGAWNSLPLLPAQTTVSPVAPGSPANGNLWFNSNDMGLYVYYTDVDSSQWVQVKASSSLNTTIPARMDNLEAKPLALNYLLNADFGINQRNFTSTGTTNTYGYDRWIMDFSGGTVTYSAQTFTPGTITTGVGDATNYARMLSSGQSGVNDYARLTQKIEDVRTLAGQPVTVSFWAKAASGTPSVGITLEQIFGTGGSSSVPTIAPKVTVSSSWARYAVTTTIPSVAGKTIGANSTTWLELFTSCGTGLSAYSNVGVQNAQIDFFGVQLEYGTAATSFRRNQNTQQAELAACQRYFVRFGGRGNAYDTFGAGAGNSATRADALIRLPVTMRITPSIAGQSNLAFYDNINPVMSTTISLSNSQCSQDALWAFGTVSSAAQYRPYFLSTNNNAAGYLDITAEL